MKEILNICLILPNQFSADQEKLKQWSAAFERNIALAIRKNFKERINLFSLVPGGNTESAKKGDSLVLVPLLHADFLQDKKYIQLIDGLIGEHKEGIQGKIGLHLNEIKSADLPKSMEGSSNYSFFKPANGDSPEEIIQPGLTTYWSRILDMVAEINQLLNKDKKGESIFLAMPSDDLIESREDIKRELVEYGFSVIPESDFKKSGKDIKSQIQSGIDKSLLVIHLIGDSYGELADLQLQYAAEYLEAVDSDPVLSKESGISRLIWISPEFKPDSEQQEELVSSLKRNIEKLARTEIIQTPMELLKSLILKRLRESSKQASVKPMERETGKKLVYLIHDKSQAAAIAELDKMISAKNTATCRLDFENAKSNLIQEHKQNLKNCDGAIIYYGTSNRLWLQSKIMDLMKAPGYGRNVPIGFKFILVATDDKLDGIKIPGDVVVSREKDLQKAVSEIMKNI